MLGIIGYIFLGVILNKLNMLNGWWLVLYILGWILDMLFATVKYLVEND